MDNNNDLPPINPDEAAYFSRFFGGGTAKDPKDKAEDALMLSFASMATFFMIKTLIYQSSDPKKAREELISMWKQSIWDVYNKDINLHAHMMTSTHLGKMFGEMIGDSETMRVEIQKRVRNVEKQLRLVLTDPNEGKTDGGYNDGYPKS